MIKKIMIAEDELAIRRPLAIRLKEEGFDVLETENGEEALAVSLAEHPDLILLDVVMPKMDGLSMLSELRKDKWGKDAHVIIFTNQADMEKIATATEQGAKEYIAKSDMSLEEIVVKIKSI